MAGPMIPAVDNPQWCAQDRDFKRHFLLSPKAKWPVSGMDAVTVSGVKLWVDALKPGSKPGKARLKAMCPVCNRIVSGGTYNQHRKVHP